MSLSKRLRFDIFKRDDFSCGYCGSRPPHVILEVDHIIAVSNGGSDEKENLITSCFDCNRGKSAKALENKPAPLLLSSETERDKLAQLKEYQKFLQQKAKLFEKWFRRVSDYWVAMDGSDPVEYVICGEPERTVRNFLKRMPAEEIIDALQIANARITNSPHRRFKFFCGVCWKKIRDSEGVFS